MKKLLFTFTTLILLYNLALYYVNNYKKERSIPLNSCSKIWSSRGIYNSHDEQNSLVSFSRAFQSGYKGVEVDAYYNKEQNRFIISHANPKKNKLTKELFTLEDLFKKLGKGHLFWLDFKNLDKLSTTETKAAIKRLNTIMQPLNLKQRVYIEGSNPLKLQLYTQNGFLTLFAFSPLKQSSIFSSISSNFYKIIYYMFDISAIAMPYGKKDNPKYNQNTQKNLKGIPTFLFHIPADVTLVKQLLEKKDLKVLLVGRDQSISMSYLNRCDKQTFKKNNN